MGRKSKRSSTAAKNRKGRGTACEATSSADPGNDGNENVTTVEHEANGNDYVENAQEQPKPTGQTTSTNKRKSTGTKKGKKAETITIVKLAEKEVLTKEDVTCPICWSVLFEPVTLPCNHSLCEVCFRKHIDETSLTCPCCRLRLSVWSRTNLKGGVKLTDVDLWTRIQKDFPKHIEARRLGVDTQDMFANEVLFDQLQSPDQSPVRIPKVRDGIVVSTPGKVGKELLEQLEMDREMDRRREETASAGLIQQLSEEEQNNLQAHMEAEERDREIAKQLHEQFKAEDKLARSQNTKPAHHRRNLMDTWVNHESSDICSLPVTLSTPKMSSQQQKKRSLSQNVTKISSSKKKQASTLKKRKSVTPTNASATVSRASQDVMSKFLSQSQNHTVYTDVTSSTLIEDDNQEPCCSSSIPKHDIRFSAFSPTKPLTSHNVFVPSAKKLALHLPNASRSPAPTSRENALDLLSPGFDKKALLSDDQLSTTSSKTPDSIKSEVDRHFRPIKSAPKTPPRKRLDGTFLPEAKVLRTTPIRPVATITMLPNYAIPPSTKDEVEHCTSHGSNKLSGAIIEKRISNDSGTASDDSRSPGVSPTTSSGKGSDVVSSTASVVNVDQNPERGCTSDDYRVTPESATPLKLKKSKKRSNVSVDDQSLDDSPSKKKMKTQPREKSSEVCSTSFGKSTSIRKMKIEPSEVYCPTSDDQRDPFFGDAVVQLKVEPLSPSLVATIKQGSPIKSNFNFECSQGIITIGDDDEGEEYFDQEKEALERYKIKAEQEARDRAFAEALQRELDGTGSRAAPTRDRNSRERYSIRTWLQPESGPPRQLRRRQKK